MADKLIPVNSNVSVMASQVIAVTASSHGHEVMVHTVDGERYSLSYSMINERWAAKARFEQLVNDAVAGE
ncbi:hypothetical protein CBW22_07560 [Pantoea sp. VS1]|uniref:hypothetical protein n=1 Tax=Pantoea sp. VS1 TaxID=2003658 RepID=UPI000B50CA6A|nr:hypothetical protein [Pantoea sp. VS1]OWS76309.1 hypothetical protein CBW22_07560 [Pantoea sp. VS1]